MKSSRSTRQVEEGTRVEEIAFHGGVIQAVRTGPGEEGIFVSPKRICENFGISWSRQRKKLEECGWAVVAFMATTGSDGKQYQMAMLDLKSLPMWLATIQVSRVSAEAKPLLLAYQKECRDVLYQHFVGNDGHQAFIENLIAKVPENWKKTFPNRFFKLLWKLRPELDLMEFDDKNLTNPLYFGHLINDIIYDRIAPGVRETIDGTIPRDEQGNRTCHKHQMIKSEAQGILRGHIDNVMCLMESVGDWDTFKEMLNVSRPSHRAAGSRYLF